MAPPPLSVIKIVNVTVGSLGLWEHKRLGLSYNIYWNAVSYKKQADDVEHMNTIYVQIWKVGDEIRAEYTTPE